MKNLLLLVLTLLISPPLWAIKMGIQNHTRGDVIALASDDDVAHFCNFTLQIVITADHVLCVYNGARPNTDYDSSP